MHGHGDLSRLAVADIPRPELRADADVRVQLHAAALNRLDLWTLEGLPGLSLKFPHILGADGAGVVEAVGRAVSSAAAGDRVMINPGIACYRCEYCGRGDHPLCERYGILGEHLPGTLAEYVVVPEQNVVRVPDLPAGQAPLSWAEAAAFSLVTLTAWRMVAHRARVKPGEAVLIHGVGGGVSGRALEIAKLLGAVVVVTSSSDEKLERARALGADVTVNYTRDDVAKATRAALGRRSVDVVIENVGEATWDLSLRLLGRGGRLVTCGATTGPRVTIDVRRLFWYQWDILGSTMGGLDEYREVVGLLEQGKLRPVVDAVYPLDDGVAAVERLARGEQFGKVAIEIPPA
jgi:NADPH:quinone reductase-like Zn-dependent oxidoreductase